MLPSSRIQGKIIGQKRCRTINSSAYEWDSATKDGRNLPQLVLVSGHKSDRFAQLLLRRHGSIPYPTITKGREAVIEASAQHGLAR